MNDDITTNDQDPEVLESDPQSQVSGDTTKKAAPKPRSPVERLLVWGLISVLLVVVAVEMRARFGYQRTLNGFENVGGENGSEFMVTLPEFSKVVAFSPTVTTGSSSTEVVDGEPVTKQYDDESQGTEKTVQYKWRSFFKEYSILLTVSTDENQEILSIQTNTPVSRHSEMMFGSRPNNGVASSGTEDMDDDDDDDDDYADDDDDDDDDYADDDDEGDEDRGGGPAGGHRRQMRSFEEMDANGDGKLTSDEVSERMQSFFERIDANGDGVIEKAELEEARSRLRSRGDGERPRDADRENAPEQAKPSETGAPAAESAVSQPEPSAPHPESPAPPDESEKPNQTTESKGGTSSP